MAKKIDPKAKAKRQKIIAAVLGVVLLAVLAWQIPSLMKTLNKKPPASAVAPPPPAAGVPAAGTPVSAAVPATPGTLSDSDPAPQAGSGQLLSFDRFSSKDPFEQQAVTPKTTAPAAEADAAKPVGPPPPPPPPASSSKQPAARPTMARISVNGTAGDVAVGSDFPAGDPVFHLVSLTRKSAKVSIAGGTLSTGSSVTLTKGKKLTLMNTADGTRYELVLVSVS